MSSASPRILVLDPEPFMQELLRLKLEAVCGGEVVFAADEKEARKLLLEKTIDLVVLEILHPRLDAYRLVQWFKNQPGLEGTKLVILTFKRKTPEIFFLYNVWIERYFEKPFYPDLFAAEVREILKSCEAA